MTVPNIRPSSDLRNNYAAISEWCHENKEPIYITKNVKGDLVVMTIEDYEGLVGRFELQELLDEGIEAVRQGKVRPFRDALRDIDEEFTK